MNDSLTISMEAWNISRCPGRGHPSATSFTEQSQLRTLVMSQCADATLPIRLDFSSSNPMRDSLEISMKQSKAGNKAHFLGNKANEGFSLDFNAPRQRRP